MSIKLYNFHNIYDLENDVLKEPSIACKYSSDCSNSTDDPDCSLCNEITQSIHNKLSGDQMSKDNLQNDYIKLKQRYISYQNILNDMIKKNNQQDKDLKENDKIIVSIIKSLKAKNELFEKLKLEIREKQELLQNNLAQREIKRNDYTSIYFTSIPTKLFLYILFVICILLSSLIIYYFIKIIRLI